MTVLIWFTSFIVISINYEGSWKKRIVAAITLLCITAIVDYTVLISLGFTFSVLFGEAELHTNLSMIISLLLLYTTALILHNFKNLKKGVNISKTHWVPALTMLLASILLTAIIAVYGDMTSFVALLIGAIIWGMNMIVIYFLDSLSAAHEEKLKLMLHFKEKEYYFAQCQLMKESVEHIMSIRHDMKIHFATIKGYSMRVNAVEITEYVNSLLDDIGEVEIYSDTGNIAIDSIINYKLKNVKQENIKTEIRSQIPSVLNVDGADIATILGNLLDNALDAVSKVEEKIIKLKIEHNKGVLFIQLDNTFDGVVKHTDDIEGTRIITRKNGDANGYGLENIKRSIGKYNGHMTITYEHNIFSVAILLYI